MVSLLGQHTEQIGPSLPAAGFRPGSHCESAKDPVARLSSGLLGSDAAAGSPGLSAGAAAESTSALSSSA